MAVASKKSIHDYPEHLNPFHEDDNHSRLRFWTIGRKKTRSNSFSFNTLKDFRNTLTLRSFRKKDGKNSIASPVSCISVQNSPVEYRKSYHVNPDLNRNTSVSQPQFDGFSTPLPRSRFHERISHIENKTPELESPTIKNDRVSVSSPTSHRDGQPFALPGLTDKKSYRGSCSSLQSNPFEDTNNSPLRASSRKKRRAPLPPISSAATPRSTIVPNITITDTSVEHVTSNTSVRRKLLENETIEKDEIDIEDPSFKMELRIIEDCDEVEVIDSNIVNTTQSHQDIKLENTNLNHNQIENIHLEESIVLNHRTNEKALSENNKKDIKENVNGVSEDVNNSDEEVFKKVDIITYKKQQSQENESKNYFDKQEHVNIKLEVEVNNHIKDDKLDKKNKVNEWELSEFSEFDKIIHEIENTAIAYIDEDDTKLEDTKKNTSLQTKYNFENCNNEVIADNEIRNSSPNPIPKPRRAKLFTKSVSSDSSKASSPSSPIE